MSELRKLAGAVRELGESCAALSHAEHGAVASLREAVRILQGSKDTGDIADALQVAGVTWQEIETATQAAAMDAYRFGSSLA